MECFTRKVVLVKEKTERFDWAGAVANGHGSLIVFEGDADKFKSLLTEANKEGNNLSDSLSVVEQSLSTSTGRLCIEMLSIFSKSRNAYKAWFEVDDTLFTSLSDVMISPKISIEGTFSLKKFPIRVDVDLATTKTVEEFEGAAKIVELLNCYAANPSTYASIEYSIILEWKDFKWKAIAQSNNAFKKLFTSKLLADCSILAAENKEIKCHKCVLAASSDVFHAMLTSGLQESQTSIIEMTDAKEEVVTQLLAFCYGLPLKIDEMTGDLAFDLFRLAHKYNVSSLEGLMLKTLFLKTKENLEMDLVFELYFFTKNISDFEVLSDKMVNIMRSKPKEVTSSASYQKLLEDDSKEAALLAMKLLELGPI